MTKDRAKALVSAGLRRSSCDRGLERLAKAGGCSKRTLEKAQAAESLPSFEVLLNMLDEDPSILDEALRAKGWQILPIAGVPADDFELQHAACDFTSEFSLALIDRVRTHDETMKIGPKASRLLPGLVSVVTDWARLRGAD
ncbi:MAG: hypothetical protein IE929_17895 [Rhizorhabdus sp.]|nr:hypothetical protein [Rhizorhabdus sp.]